MKRWLFFTYGVANYLLFFGTYAFLCGFVGNFLVPKTIDAPAYAGSEGVAAAVNLVLLLLFAVQHSLMARPAFKQLWTQIVPQAIERSTYVLASCLVTILLIWLWRPIDLIVWHVEQPALRGVLWSLFAVGWLLVPAVSLMIDHFDLFGIRQVWLYLRGQQYQALPFRVPMLYKRMRHPLYLGWAIAFWAIPTMTAGHLLLAGVLTGYMAAAAFVEERDLVAHFGRQYEDYRRRVPMFVPSIRATDTKATTDQREVTATTQQTV